MYKHLCGWTLLTGALTIVGLSFAEAPAEASAQSTVICRNLGRPHVYSLQPTLGHARTDIALTNVSGSVCRVDGYPRVTLFNHEGRKLNIKEVKGADPQEAHDPGTQDVILDPGRTAVFALTNTVFSDGRDCQSSAQLSLRLNGLTIVVPHAAIAPCGYLDVTAITLAKRNLNIKR